MASYTQRPNGVLAQVRKKEDGVIVFSESKLLPTQGEAETWANALEAKLKKEGVVSTTIRDKTLGALILDHLEYLQRVRPNLGPSAIQNHQYMAQQFKDLKLGAMRAKHFIDFAVRRRTQDQVSPATILANLSPVSAAIHAAPFAHNLKVDPTEIDIAIKRLKEQGVVAKSRQIVRLVDQVEEDALLVEFRRRNAMPQTDIDMELMYHWGLALPRRVSELCRIRWADVNPKKKTVVIRDVKHPRKKSGNDQEVPLLPAAWHLLEQTPKLDAQILPFNSDSVSAAFERVRNRIAETGLPSIEDLRFHDLRHTGITMLFWAGHPIEEVAVVSGHTNWTQLKRYTHIKPEDLHRRYDPEAAAKPRLSSIVNLTTAAAKKTAPQS
jgi:integrase